MVISIIAILFSGVLAYEIMDYPQEARLFPLVFLGFFTLFMVIGSRHQKNGSQNRERRSSAGE